MNKKFIKTKKGMKKKSCEEKGAVNDERNIV